MFDALGGLFLVFFEISVLESQDYTMRCHR